MQIRYLLFALLVVSFHQFAATATIASGPATIVLKNSRGLRWQLEKRCGHWTLGTLFVHDKPVDAPLASGILALRNVTSQQVFWPAATEGKQLDERSARFSGSDKIGDVMFRFEVDVALKEEVPAATLGTPLVSRQGS